MYIRSRGFTLVEALASLFIVTLIGVGIATFARNIFFWNSFLSSDLNVQDEARRAFKTMSAELRTMQPSSLGAYPIAQVATSSVTFYTNIDSDDVVERVRYYLSGTTLRRGVIEPTGSPLVYNAGAEVSTDMLHYVLASSTIFSYYDSSYNGTGAALSQPVDVSRVRLIQFSASLDRDVTRPPAALVFTSQVELRNLKDNL